MKKEEDKKTMRYWIPDVNGNGIDGLDSNEAFMGAMLLHGTKEEHDGKPRSIVARILLTAAGITGLAGIGILIGLVIFGL